MTGIAGTRPAARGEPTTSSARAPTPTRWPPSWRRRSSAGATSRRSTRAGSGPIPGAFAGDGRDGRLPHRAVRRRGQAAGELRRLRERVQPRPRSSEPSDAGPQRRTPTLILHGTSDHVIYPGVRPDGGGRVRPPRRPVPAPRLRPLRAVGGAARARQRHRRVLQRPPRGVTPPATRMTAQLSVGCVAPTSAAHVMLADEAVVVEAVVALEGYDLRLGADAEDAVDHDRVTPLW